MQTDNPADDIIYEGEIGEDHINIWWWVNTGVNFDFYYLSVTDEDDDVIYCTVIPCPTDPWISWYIEALNPGECYTFTLSHWRYTETNDPLSDPDGNELFELNIQQQIFTGKILIIFHF